MSQICMSRTKIKTKHYTSREINMLIVRQKKVIECVYCTSIFKTLCKVQCFNLEVTLNLEVRL